MVLAGRPLARLGVAGDVFGRNGTLPICHIKVSTSETKIEVFSLCARVPECASRSRGLERFRNPQLRPRVSLSVCTRNVLFGRAWARPPYVPIKRTGCRHGGPGAVAPASYPRLCAPSLPLKVLKSLLLDPVLAARQVRVHLLVEPAGHGLRTRAWRQL